jgi:hypothetical protein
MTSPPTPSVASSGRALLVERYISTAAAARLSASTARVAGLCAESVHSGLEVQYLFSVYLPTEDTCFCLFWAPTIEAVRAVNQQAEFAFDRIIHAELLPPHPAESRPWPSKFPPDQGDRNDQI